MSDAHGAGLRLYHAPDQSREAHREEAFRVCDGILHRDDCVASHVPGTVHLLPFHRVRRFRDVADNPVHHLRYRRCADNRDPERNGSRQDSDQQWRQQESGVLWGQPLFKRGRQGGGP